MKIVVCIILGLMFSACGGTVGSDVGSDAGVDAGVDAGEDTGKWIIGSETDEITDDVMHYAFLESENLGKWGKSYLLIFRCLEGELDTYIVWEEFIDTDPVVVTTRFDDAQPENETWDISTGYDATFHRNPGNFLNKTFGKERLLARVTPYSENPITAEFELYGVKNATINVRENCF